MEELTIEQKAKRYDEAIEKAKEYYNKGRVPEFANYITSDIFPELKEKTDEEMIQKLIAVCHLYYGEGEDRERDECLEWLEKQGEQKSDPYNGLSFVYNNHTWGMCARDGGVDILCDSKLIKHIEYLQYKTILENLSEQKQEWSEEDDNGLGDALWAVKQARTIAKNENEMGGLWYAERWLKSIKDRIQSKPRKKNIEQNLAKKYGITGIGSKHAEGKLGEMIKKKIETEKQDKQKFGQLEECLDCQFNYAGTCEGSCHLTRGELKPTDNTNKVEPKFHEGEWVVSPMGVYLHIDAIRDGRYQVTSDSGVSVDWPLNTKLYHRFTIQDAEDGDVLTWDDNKCITLFKNIYDEESFNSHGFVGRCTNKFESRISYHDIEGVHPAAKEQCDLLFQKMKDDGCKWDSESKELIKIE